MSGDCASCAAKTGTKRYCAPARCYCGHEDCPAFASYIDVADIPLHEAEPTPRRKSSSWSDRKDATWLDNL